MYTEAPGIRSVPREPLWIYAFSFKVRRCTKVLHLTALNPHVSNVVRATVAASARGGNGVTASIMVGQLNETA